MIYIKEVSPPIKLPGISSLTVQFNYDKSLVDSIHQVPNAIWNKRLSLWEIPVTSLSRAISILSNYDDIDIELLKKENILYYRESNVGELHKNNYKVKLFKHQEEGIRYGLTHDRFLLLDQPGLGKTLQMIYLAEELKNRNNIKHCLIICGLNTLKYNWKKEIEKFSNLDCRILGERKTKNGKEKIGSVNDRLEDLKNPIKEFFIITNIETLRNTHIIDELRNKKSSNKIDMMVLDECHVCKNPSSQQGKNLLKLSSKYMIGLTGTLLLNSPLDAYVPLKWLGVENSTYTNYRYYYCNYVGPFNNILEGYKNTNVLKDELDKYSLRRTKDLLDIPEKTIIHEELDMESDQNRFYNDIVNGIVKQVDKVHINTSTILSMVTRLRQSTACPSILSSDNISAVKINRAVDLIDQIVSSGNKVVVFSVFKHTLEELRIKLDDSYNSLICTGDLKDKEISMNIDRFQNDESCKVMLATTAKMGTGITLNKASYAIFIDCPWTAAQCEQCEDRIHRIGSKEPVFVYYLWVKDTIDERVRTIVQTKEAMADYIIDNEISENSLDNLKQYILDLV